MSFNAIPLEKKFEHYRTKIITIISPQHLNLTISLILQEITELFKVIEELRFTLDKIYMYSSIIVINE